MKTNSQLMKEVAAKLGWDHAINAAQVGVTVKGRVVSLNRHLNTFAEKRAVQALATAA